MTGEIGVGKTTVCEKIAEDARKTGIKCTGILTRRFKMKGNVILEVEELSTRERKVLAQKRDDGKIPKGIHICPYVFDDEAIEFAKATLLKRGELLIIDEVGPLELRGEGFGDAWKAFEDSGNRNALLVTRNEVKEEFEKLLKRSHETYEVTNENRDDLPGIILSSLLNQHSGRRKRKAHR